MKATLLAVCVLLLSANAAAGNRSFVYVQEGAEVMELTLNKASTQLVYAKVCDQCPTLALTVNAKTRLYAGRSALTLAQASALNKRGGTVFFDPKTRLVSRIVFWQ